MFRIEVTRRHYLLYLLLPHHMKVRLLSVASREMLDEINRKANQAIYSGDAAAGYDQRHRYDEAEQHEYPAKLLIAERWAPEGYGRALEVGAGTGYFTALIARRAQTVLALEPVPDMRRVLEARCRREHLTNVHVMAANASDLSSMVPRASLDSVVIIQSLHHFHRRDEIFESLGHVVRPGGRLFLIEPHHNLRRVARLARYYLTTYRARAFWTQAENWATHDFLTRGELRALCARGRFTEPKFSGYWIPYASRLVHDPAARLRLERVLGRLPALHHFAGVVTAEARRRQD